MRGFRECNQTELPCNSAESLLVYGSFLVQNQRSAETTSAGAGRTKVLS
jgi:hypothetical protein